MTQMRAQMTQESETDVGTIGIKLDRRITKSRAIRDVLRQLDNFYAGGSTPDVPSPSQALDQDPDVSDDSGVGPSADSSTVQHGLDGDADTGGESMARSIGEGEETDEESSGHQDPTPVEAGGSDEQQTPAERVLEESEERSGQYGRSDFHFAPHFHSRGA